MGDSPRLLARGASVRYRTLPGGRQAVHDVEHEAEHGYTSDASRALFAEPEAVDREEQRRITAAAARSAREADRDEWFRRREAIERELDWLFSRRFQRDVTVQVRALRRQLDRVDRRLQV